MITVITQAHKDHWNENGWSQIESLAKMASLKNKLINDQIWHVNLLFLADPNLTNEIEV